MGRLFTFGVLLVAISFTTQRYLSAGITASFPCAVFGAAYCPDGTVRGTISKGYESVARTMKSLIERGETEGLTVSVYVDGVEVVNAAAGWRADGRPYTTSTVGLVCSSSKTVSSVALAIAMDRSGAKYSDLVTKYWPEFGQNGKDRVTIGDLMQHSGGVGMFDEPISDEELLGDVKTFEAKLARQPHNFGGNKTLAYNCITRDLYTEVLIRRMDGRSLQQFVREELVQPLDITLAFGRLNLAKHEQDHFEASKSYSPARLITQVLGNGIIMPLLPDIDSIKLYTDPSTVQHKSCIAVLEKASSGIRNPHTLSTQLQQNVVLGSVNANTNAHGLASIAAILANGGILKGRRFLNESFVREMLTHDVYDFDQIVSLWRKQQWTFGGLANINNNVIRQGNGGQGIQYDVNFYGWQGYGGSIIWASPEANIAFSFVPDTFFLTNMDYRGIEILKSVLTNAVRNGKQLRPALPVLVK